MDITKVSDDVRKDHADVIRNLKKAKEPLETRWIVNRAFYDGNHFTFGQIDETGQVKKVASKKPYREIPLTTDQIDGQINMLISNKPSPYIYPDERIASEQELVDEEFRAKMEAETLAWGKAVEYLLEEEIKLRKVRRSLAFYGLLYSTAFMQVMKEKDRYKIEVYDPFEVSIYPTIKSIDEYPYLIKHIARPLKTVENSKLYSKEVTKGLKERLTENKYFENANKNNYFSSKLGYADPQTVVIDELYAMEEDGLAIYSYIGDELIHAQSPEETKLKSFPFEMFLTGDLPYGPAPIEKFMPLNRSIDILITKLENRVKRLDGGRLAIQASEPIKVISNSDGEFVRWKKHVPTPLPEENYPSTLINLIGILRETFSSLGVNAAVSSTGLPAGVEAWRAIESLKQADYGKMESLRQNMEECLTGITEKLIELISVEEVTPRTLILPETQERIQIMGEAGVEDGGQGPEGVLVFNAQKRLKVVIESALTHTPEATRQFIMELVGQQLLPPEIAIDRLKLGNTKEIMEKLTLSQTAGQSMVDMPDFAALPKKLQMAIVQYLSEGADPAVREQIDGEEFNQQ